MDGSQQKNGRRKDPEKVLEGKFHNKSTIRKQRTRGKDVVQRDAVQILGIRG